VDEVLLVTGERMLDLAAFFPGSDG
jgi:hypothetical protein